MADEEEEYETPAFEPPAEFSTPRVQRILNTGGGGRVTPYQAERLQQSQQSFEWRKQQAQQQQALRQQAADMQRARAEAAIQRLAFDVAQERLKQRTDADYYRQSTSALEQAAALDFSSPTFQRDRLKILAQNPRAVNNPAIQSLYKQHDEQLSTYQKNFREDTAMRKAETATQGMVPSSVTGNTVTYKQPEQRYGLTDEQKGIAEQLNAKYGLDSSALAPSGVKVSAGRFNPSTNQFDYDPNGADYRVVTSSKPDSLGNPVEKSAIIPKAEYEDFKIRFNAPRQAAASVAASPSAPVAQPTPVDTAAFIRSFITKPKRKDTP